MSQLPELNAIKYFHSLPQKPAAVVVELGDILCCSHGCGRTDREENMLTSPTLTVQQRPCQRSNKCLTENKLIHTAATSYFAHIFPQKIRFPLQLLLLFYIQCKVNRMMCVNGVPQSNAGRVFMPA